MQRRSSQRGAIDCRAGRWSLRLRYQERVGNRWRVKTRRYFLGTTKKIKTKAAARIAADEFLERTGRAVTTGRSIAFDKFARIYRDTQVAGLAYTTRGTYIAILENHLIPYFKSTPLGEIKGPIPGVLVAALIAKGLSRGYVQASIGIVTRMIYLAASMGYAVTPINRRSYRLPPADPSGEQRVFTPDESRRIIAAAKYPWMAFFALMAYAGLRCSEALAIEWRDVDLIERRIRVRQAAASGRTKAVKSRNSAAELPIGSTLGGILMGLWRRREAESKASPAGLLFPSPRGGPYWSSGVRRDHLAPILETLGIAPAGLHAFRHGYATNLLAAGTPPNVVQTMLRHGDIKTTLRYSHVNSEDMRRAAASADELLNAP